jgi:hypothetical protein
MTSSAPSHPFGSVVIAVNPAAVVIGHPTTTPIHRTSARRSGHDDHGSKIDKVMSVTASVATGGPLV